MRPAASARLALTLLAVQAVGLLAFAMYVVFDEGLSFSGVVNSVDALLAAGFVWVWRGLLASTFAMRPVPPEQGAFRIYRYGYPVLLLWRTATLYLILVSLSFGANFTVSLVVLLIATAAALWVNWQTFVVSLKLVQKPLEAGTRARLRSLLEYGAALSALLTIMNLWPPAGLDRPTLTEGVVWGLSGALDVAATLAVRAALLQKTKG